jgi:hypothetical protein
MLPKRSPSRTIEKERFIMATPVTPDTTPVQPIPNATSLQSPPSVTLPALPDGYDPKNKPHTRGSYPKKAELSAVPDAVRELGMFADYEVVFGKTAPDAAQLAEGLTVSAEWMVLLAEITAFLTYVRMSTAVTWLATRGLVESLKAPFELASKNDTTLPAKYPGLARLLGAAKVIARKGVSTRDNNKKAEASGKPQTHGNVGRKRITAAGKKALAEEAAKSAAPAATNAPATGTPHA